jgi:signal peptidase II
MRRWLVFSFLALLGATADWGSKSLALKKVPEHGEHVVIPGYFSIGHLYNEGIVFGKFQNAKKIWLIVSILAVPAIVGIFASMKNPRWIFTVSLGLILAGTLGNLYDRWEFGKVRDFIKFSYDAEHVWPLFNLADAYICAGVMMLSVEMIFFDDKKKQKIQEAVAAHEAKSQTVVSPQTPVADGSSGPVDGDRPAPPG